MEHSIEVHGLRKDYGSETAIKDVTYQVEKGEIFGLLGPSGSGKTTMIKILTGELRETGGDVQVLGFDADAFYTPVFRSRIGILSDNSALYERLSVKDNLKLFCKLYDAPLKAIDNILKEVGLDGERSKIVSKLSKGMKQRILLAKALIHKPEVVFLDEPTSSLDPGSMEEIHRMLQQINESGTTIFLTTHDMEEATALCDRVAFLHKGSFEELASPDDLRYKYSTHQFHVDTVDGEQLVIDNTPANAEQIRDLIAAGQVKMMHTDHPTLGQIFLKITGKELV